MRDFSFGHLLTSYRNRLGWTQQEVIDSNDPLALQVSLRTYQKWENGESIPSSQWLQRIAILFQLNDSEKDELYRAAAQFAPKLDNLPFHRNPYFTGRDELLTHLHTLLQKSHSAAIGQRQAISGLGGIGKTQIALEYAYRYRQDYQAVFWVRAESTEALNSSYNELANLLNLPQKDAQEQEVVVQAVKSWLHTHQRWLLILDNANEPDLLSRFLPPTTDGHILLTTRATGLGGLGLGLAHPIQVEPFLPEEGALFLLHRSGLLILDQLLNQATLHDQELAKQIVREMGGLPLALDLAGAYIAATKRSLIEYLDIYQQHRLDLLKQHRNRDYPESVATTWDISFKQVESKNPAAVELMRFCAYLAPSAIPETILTKGAPYLGPILSLVAADSFLLVQAIEALRAYSLLDRSPQTQALFVHPLVQVVLRDSMEAEMAREWKQRSVLAVEEVAKPDTLDVTQWNICEQWLPHALMCAIWIVQEQFDSEKCASLLSSTALYLKTRGRYDMAEPLCVQALAICEQRWGSEHLKTAISLNNLAQIYRDQGKRDLAKSLFIRALAIFERKSGIEDVSKILEKILLEDPAEVLKWKSRPEDHDMLAILNNFAGICVEEEKYELAGKLYMSALLIYGQLKRPPDIPPDELYIPADNDFFFARTMNNMGELCRIQGKYEEAVSMYKAALEAFEETVGPNHYIIANSLNNLALTYHALKKYEEAESLCVRALAIREQQLGLEHPRTVDTLHNLVAIYASQGKFEQAEPLWVQQLEIYEQILGPEHPVTANTLSSLAAYYRDQGKYEKAESLYMRQLGTYEQVLGPEHLYTAISRNNLARLFLVQGKYEKAESLFVWVLKVFEQQLGREHPDTASILNNMGIVYMALGRFKQAESFYERALAINKKQLGPQHPKTLDMRRNYADLLRVMGRDEEAKQVEERF